jgi:GDPmannose 4,6-dehydratase
MSGEKPRRALISGITGQDGAYLTELLLSKGYEVHGTIRRSSQLNTQRIDKFYEDPHVDGRKLVLHYGDLSDSTSLVRIVALVQPHEIYNLGAQSHVGVSFECPEYTADVDGLGTLRLLEAVRICGLEKTVKFYQASTSELYGNAEEFPQKITTPFRPRSPYAAAKLYAYWITVNYRESYGMYACNGVLFNHESPLRGETFVTRKITRAVSRIKLGLQKKLYVGNLDAKRDWGHARDYVEMMWRMLQEDEPRDYVISTGEQHSVREFVEATCAALDVPMKWRGEGIDEEGYREDTGETIVAVDPRYFRPSEVDSLLGDSSDAKNMLGWTPSTPFEDLVRDMAFADLEIAKRELRAAIL